MTTWHTAPAGLYHLRDGRALPILLVNETGEGLLPDGTRTRHIHAHLDGWTPTPPDQARSHSNDYMAAVRQAQLDGTPECPHGEPRGVRYCPRCRRTTWQANA